MKIVNLTGNYNETYHTSQSEYGKAVLLSHLKNIIKLENSFKIDKIEFIVDSYNDKIVEIDNYWIRFDEYLKLLECINGHTEDILKLDINYIPCMKIDHNGNVKEYYKAIYIFDRQEIELFKVCEADIIQTYKDKGTKPVAIKNNECK